MIWRKLESILNLVRQIYANNRSFTIKNDGAIRKKINTRRQKGKEEEGEMSEVECSLEEVKVWFLKAFVVGGEADYDRYSTITFSIEDYLCRGGPIICMPHLEEIWMVERLIY